MFEVCVRLCRAEEADDVCILTCWIRQLCLLIDAVCLLRLLTFPASLQLIVKAQTLFQTNALYQVVNNSYVPMGPAEVCRYQKLIFL